MKKHTGITLIALVITIIVLLILAGVVLSLVAGNEGILSKAETAFSETKISGAKEQAELLLAEISAEFYEKKYVDKTESGTIVDYIKTSLASGKATSNGDYTVTVDSSGNVTVTDEAGNEVVTGTLEESGKAIWTETSGGSGSGGSGSIGETYYGDASVLPTDQKYFTFTINEDGQTATITGIKDEYAVKGYYGDEIYMCEVNRAINDNGTYITEVAIPYEYVDDSNNRYTVTVLGTNVFGNVDHMFGMYSGEYTEMFTDIVIPNTITQIEQGAFVGTRKLTQINIPNSVTDIGEGAFSCSGLTSVSIPDSVTEIKFATFYGCTRLSSINIPEGVINIGNWAFSDCTNLSSINIPESVTTIGSSAFYRWTEEQTINCEILEANKPSGWDAKWDYYDYSTARKAALNWGVSMENEDESAV